MQISQCRNLHQDLHTTAISLIHRMNFRAAPFISELGEQRLHTDALYTQDKSSIMNISIYTYWKLAEPWQFKQSYRTPHRKHWSTVRISERLRDCSTSFFRKTLLLDPRSLIIEARDSILALETLSVQASRCENRVSSFDDWVSTYLWVVLYIKRKTIIIRFKK